MELLFAITNWHLLVIMGAVVIFLIFMIARLPSSQPPESENESKNWFIMLVDASNQTYIARQFTNKQWCLLVRDWSPATDTMVEEMMINGRLLNMNEVEEILKNS